MRSELDDVTKLKSVILKQQHYIKDLERKLRIERRKVTNLESDVTKMRNMMRYKGE
jgi:hypothetical protein